jgi:6-pyruvoyltetrahydropterin/6-carboxytetrahydropterin synthase
VIAVTRRYRFPAAHVLRQPSLSDAENERIYGKCANPAGHGHDYGLEVTIEGEIDPRTGSVIAPDALDRLVRERLLERFGHRLLNDDPLFAERVPTAENIAQVAFEEMRASVRASAPAARLRRVRVVETPRNQFEYGETE